MFGRQAAVLGKVSEPDDRLTDPQASALEIPGRLTNVASPARCIASRSSATVLLDADCATHRLCNGTGLLTLPASSRLRSVSFVRRAGTRRLRLAAPAAAPAVRLERGTRRPAALNARARHLRLIQPPRG